jgi:predicted ATPase
MPATYVLTGGPSAGKTTLLERFRLAGYQTVSEAARQLMEERKIDSGMLMNEDRLEFQKAVLKKQLELEAALAAAPAAFLDRGVPDGLAYCKLAMLTPPAELREAAGRNRYSNVFFLEQLPGYTTDAVRREDSQTALTLCRLLREAYEECGYTPIDVPALPLDERAEFITRYLL